MYTSTTEVRASLLQAGLDEDDVSRGILAWLDAPRPAQATTAKALVENVLKSTQGMRAWRQQSSFDHSRPETAEQNEEEEERPECTRASTPGVAEDKRVEGGESKGGARLVRGRGRYS